MPKPTSCAPCSCTSGKQRLLFRGESLGTTSMRGVPFSQTSGQALPSHRADCTGGNLNLSPCRRGGRCARESPRQTKNRVSAPLRTSVCPEKGGTTLCAPTTIMGCPVKGSLQPRTGRSLCATTFNGNSMSAGLMFSWDDKWG